LEWLRLENDPSRRQFGQDARRWCGINDHYDDARTNYDHDCAVHHDPSADNDGRAC
jgi:hypothetical protein